MAQTMGNIASRRSLAMRAKSMKKTGHYCKICGEHKANEKFSGKGHAAHICKSCAAMPLEERNQAMTLTRILNPRYPSDSRSLSTALQPARSQRSHAEIMRLLLQPSTDWRGSSCGVRWSRCRRHRRGYDAVKRAATLCLPHILHGDTVDRGCSYL